MTDQLHEAVTTMKRSAIFKLVNGRHKDASFFDVMDNGMKNMHLVLVAKSIPFKAAEKMVLSAAKKVGKRVYEKGPMASKSAWSHDPSKNSWSVNRGDPTFPVLVVTSGDGAFQKIASFLGGMKESVMNDSTEALDEALEVFEAIQTLSEAEKKKGVDGELQRAAKRGWVHNPWHGTDGKFTSRDSAKSASTSSPASSSTEHPKYRDKMGGGAPGKKVAQTCGRHARSKGLDIRCQDKSAKPK